MVGGWLDVCSWVVEVWWDGTDELGTGGKEEFLEDWEGLGAAALHAEELVTVFLTEGGVDCVVKTGRAEGDADGKEGVHLIVLLGDLCDKMLEGEGSDPKWEVGVVTESYCAFLLWKFFVRET